MPLSRREAGGVGSFAKPLLTIVALIASYVVLARWEDLPRMIDSAFAAVHWPISG
ncbi:MAG TPA: hypothetical protein VHB27_00355 [Rhodopila sp.]|uniref:hypothetical protein n=1 Tax=Rhodopila sp. TaxID=2480087 RepID=UPI002CAA27BA|nr:hypothetical protein [Rhodopila sp.]HVY13645.1 hypothetical protein [Rhodopila sp.]